MVSHIFSVHRLLMKSVESSSQQLVKEETCFYLPDECWESIFRFIDINDYDENLRYLSFVSKQFLSITNGLIFSLSVNEENRHFLPRLFKRFTNINAIDLTHFSNMHNLDYLLTQISTFPLKITLLRLPYRCCFPADGLQTFSQNITTLTSLTCDGTYFGDKDLSPIVDRFPLLEELNLYHPLVIDSNKPIFVKSIHSLLSKCPCIQRLELKLSSTYFLNDQHVVDFSLFLGNLVSINLSSCIFLTEKTLFSLIKNCPSLSEIRMEGTWIGKETVHSLVEFGVYPQLKSLYLGRNSCLRYKMLIMFTSIFPNLQLLDLHHCYISKGICEILRKCCKLKHLNLAFCPEMYLHKLNFVVPELEVLNLSNTKVNDKTLYAISKSCCGLLQLQLNNCKNVTEKGVEHLVENCTQLREINLGDIYVSDKNRELLSHRGCRIC